MPPGTLPPGQDGPATPPAVRDGSWQVLAASVCGSAHEKAGLACQDAHHWRRLPGEVLVAALADGAGSAALGGVGAAMAARAAVEWLCEQARASGPSIREDGWQSLLQAALCAARSSMEEAALGRQVALRELATTLVLVVATPEGVAAAQVGDGAAVLRDEAGEIQALTLPQVGEHLNETSFLVSRDYLASARMLLRPGRPRQIALFTDGLQMLALKMPAGAPHAPFFAPLFRFLEELPGEEEGREQLNAFLNSPRVRGRADDDLTLLLATLP